MQTYSTNLELVVIGQRLSEFLPAILNSPSRRGRYMDAICDKYACAESQLDQARLLTGEAQALAIARARVAANEVTRLAEHFPLPLATQEAA